MSELRGRRVLVTGATGFIGSCLAGRLASSGARVHILARASSRFDRLAGVVFQRHVGDINDPSSLAACINEGDPEFVFHLAKEREGATFEKEALATARLAAALKKNAPKLARWVRTAHAVRESSGRGADAELARSIAARFALPVVTLELYQVYGPGQHSGDPPLSPGNGAKDFVYVEDVAEAYERAALAQGVEGETFQIGSGKLTSEAEAYGIAMKLMKKKAGAAAAGRVEGHPADISAARRLGWEPRTSLETGLKHLVKWLDEGQRARRP